MKKLISSVIVAGSLALSAHAADPPKPATPPPAAPPAAKPATPPPAAPAAKDAKGAPAAPAAAAPAAAAPPAPPPPAPELAANLKGMDGKWKCDGKFPDSAFGKAHSSKADYSSKSDLNGYWYTQRYEEKKSKDNPTPYVMNTVIGFDPGKKELVRTDTDGMGAVTHLTSKGWEGDKITWAGETHAGPTKLQFKETATKKSDKEVVIAMEMAGADGTFAPLGELTCKK